MCIENSRVHRLRRWNWDGERIIHESIVPSSRPVVGQLTGGYDIDVREFLVSEKNATMHRTLEKDVKKFISKLEGATWELFSSRESGSFDMRANVITQFVSEKIKYRVTTGLDPWQFPDETLKLRSGDCEDRALLIASLLLASGISSFNVRVALGTFRAWFGKKHEDFDHVWVMYKDEAGKWQVIEPAAHTTFSEKPAKNTRMPDTAEYIPYFIFNDVHLWTMQNSALYEGKGAIKLKRNWSKLNPKFAGWVHKTILNEALTPDICPDWVLKALNRHFTSFLWKRSLTVDDVDLPGSYDPKDHFDNGYIEEGWKKVSDRLSQFQKGSIQNLDLFHQAAHGIGDFYAHSSYGEFGAIQNGKLALYNSDNPSSTLPQPPDYEAGSGFNIASGKFSTNTALWKGNAQAASALWKGKLISGRYAQKMDSHGITEAITFIPASLTKDKNFALRGSLPHHNEIAVDEDTGSNTLYAASKFAAQYKLRKDAAVRHIRKAFIENWKP
ncbi:transglutaminase domain-containing protein [Sulfurirhabdus autotrophica]|uniref:Transglutaminase superfamily protein n=1 Tax=Sulfurirhabdus autotrophica TaxID=1706046 RepID=A0A4R3YEN0_9PROT|nr:transglutaminase domain-containing protein [Sulfurirhabdus autotrophica]TCV90627.1 transglutaminase superfamily protein [Sulfurirhabdus autotrophica]